MFLICRRNQPGPLTQVEEAEQIPFNSKLITLSSAEFSSLLLLFYFFYFYFYFFLSFFFSLTTSCLTRIANRVTRNSPQQQSDQLIESAGDRVIHTICTSRNGYQLSAQADSFTPLLSAGRNGPQGLTNQLN